MTAGGWSACACSSQSPLHTRRTPAPPTAAAAAITSGARLSTTIDDPAVSAGLTGRASVTRSPREAGIFDRIDRGLAAPATPFETDTSGNKETSVRSSSPLTSAPAQEAGVTDAAQRAVASDEPRASRQAPGRRLLRPGESKRVAIRLAAPSTEQSFAGGAPPPRSDGGRTVLCSWRCDFGVRQAPVAPPPRRASRPRDARSGFCPVRRLELDRARAPPSRRRLPACFDHVTRN